MLQEMYRMVFELHMALVVKPITAAAERGEGPLISLLPAGCKRLATPAETQALRSDSQAASQSG